MKVLSTTTTMSLLCSCTSSEQALMSTTFIMGLVGVSIHTSYTQEEEGKGGVMSLQHSNGKIRKSRVTCTTQLRHAQLGKHVAKLDIQQMEKPHVDQMTESSQSSSTLHKRIYIAIFLNSISKCSDSPQQTRFLLMSTVGKFILTDPSAPGFFSQRCQHTVY